MIIIYWQVRRGDTIVENHIFAELTALRRAKVAGNGAYAVRLTGNSSEGFNVERVSSD